MTTLAVPGPLSTRTGGYEYDRRLVQHLGARGIDVDVLELDGRYPWPDRETRTRAASALAALAAGSVVIVDGLALGVLPDEAAHESARLKLIALVHHPLALETGLSPEEQRRLFESERLALGTVRAVIVTSPATVDALEPYEIAHRPVVAVPGTERAPLATGSGGDEVRILTVASMVPRKGYDLLIEALARVPDAPWRLVCVGGRRDVQTARDIEGLVAARGLRHRVVFLGELEAEPLALEYSRADLFVLPSLYEGYGMVVAEAIARGLPVVATSTGGVPSLLQDGAGLLCRPGSLEDLTAALRQVLERPDLLRTLAAASRRTREVLPSWDDTARMVESVIRTVEAA